jgi:hypothetical protein
VAQLFPEAQQLWTNNLYAIGLSLPVPLHVISVGFVLQRRWLSPHGRRIVWLAPVPLHVISVGFVLQRRWLSPHGRRIVWLAVIISGCWLGVALVIKEFLLN